MSHEAVDLTLPPALAERVRAAAAESGESVEAVVGRALEEWLGDEAEDARALEELERLTAAIAAGQPTVPNDEVAKWLDTWGTPSFRPGRTAS